MNDSFYKIIIYTVANANLPRRIYRKSCFLHIKRSMEITGKQSVYPFNNTHNATAR